MAESLSDELTGTLRTVFLFSRTDTQELGTIANTASKITNYQFTDGAGAGQADLVYAETRTIPGNTMETFDLLNLDQPTLGVNVAFTFRQLRAIRVVNESTVPGRKLFVGVNPGSPVSIYAAEVGPGSEWHAVNYLNGWQVTAENSNVSISNPNPTGVNYSLYLMGTSVTGPTATGPTGS
jgi:hypothetical protein